jgi:hypothetical protein
LFVVPTVLRFLAAQFFQVAVVTDVVVAANHFTAVGAFPRFFLFFQEFGYAVFFDEVQILYHAHPVPSLVFGVDFSESVAGEVAAFKTIRDFVV